MANFFLIHLRVLFPLHYYLKIFSLIFKVISYSILIQFQKCLPYSPDLWNRQVNWGVQQPLWPYILLTWTYTFPSYWKTDLLPITAAAMQSIYCWSHARLLVCFVIFVSRFITCPLLLLLPPPTRQLHASLRAEGNFLLLICIFKVHKMLDRRWYFPKMAQQYLSFNTSSLQNSGGNSNHSTFLPGEFLEQRTWEATTVQSMGLQKVGFGWATNTRTYTLQYIFDIFPPRSCSLVLSSWKWTGFFDWIFK